MNCALLAHNIPVIMPSCKGSSFSHIQGLPIHYDRVKVEVLIGQDNSEGLVPLDVRRGKPGELFAVRTMLGWALNGQDEQQRTKANKRYKKDISVLALKQCERYQAANQLTPGCNSW